MLLTDNNMISFFELINNRGLICAGVGTICGQDARSAWGPLFTDGVTPYDCLYTGLNLCRILPEQDPALEHI